MSFIGSYRGMNIICVVAIFDMTPKILDTLPIGKWGLCPLLSGLGWFVIALTNGFGQK